jgi:SAM-dependent methyltransferase
MDVLYQDDLAYIHAVAFGGLARGAADEIIRRIGAATIPIRTVVDAGCGAGHLSAAMVRAGFEVVGIDCSAEMISMAREAVPGARFVHGSIYDVELPRCQVIVAVGETLAYHTADAPADVLVEGFFHRAADVLPAGGLLVFDLIELGEPPLTGRFWSSGEDWVVMADTREDQASRALFRGIETFRRVGDLYRRGREVHELRLFDTAAVCDQLADCGFSVETASTYGVQPLYTRRRAFFCTRMP